MTRPRPRPKRRPGWLRGPDEAELAPREPDHENRPDGPLGRLFAPLEPREPEDMR